MSRCASFEKRPHACGQRRVIELQALRLLRQCRVGSNDDLQVGRRRGPDQQHGSPSSIHDVSSAAIPRSPESRFWTTSNHNPAATVNARLFSIELRDTADCRRRRNRAKPGVNVRELGVGQRFRGVRDHLFGGPPHVTGERRPCGERDRPAAVPQCRRPARQGRGTASRRARRRASSLSRRFRSVQRGLPQVHCIHAAAARDAAELPRSPTDRSRARHASPRLSERVEQRDLALFTRAMARSSAGRGRSGSKSAPPRTRPCSAPSARSRCSDR